MSRNTSLLMAMLVVSSSTAMAVAAPLQWEVATGGNGHWYEVVQASISWEEAQTAAAGRTVEVSEGQFVSGYLATITSAAEDEWLRSTLFPKPSSYQRAWLGGYQDLSDPGYSEPAGGWKWITGEAWGYTNWEPGEPNDWLGQEHFLEIWFEDGPSHGYWNDHKLEPDAQSAAYVVEYVPEPATLLLLVLGGLAMMRRRRRAGVSQEGWRHWGPS